MKRGIKIIAIVVVVILLLVAAGIFVLTKVVDPNDLKPRIEAQIEAHTHLDVAIKGDLSWQLWPSLSVKVGQTQTRIKGEDQPFAGFQSASMDVALKPLLSGQVKVNGVTLDGLDVHLQRDSQGSNWQRAMLPLKSAETGQGTSKQAVSADKHEDATFKLADKIALISVTHGKIHYEDEVGGQDVEVRHLDLEAKHVSLSKGFALDFAGRVQSKHQLQADVEGHTEVAFGFDEQRFDFDKAQINALIKGLAPKDMKLELAPTIHFNAAQGRLDVDKLEGSIAGITLDGSHFGITGLHDKLAWQAHLESQTFNLLKVLKSLGIEPVKLASSNALSKVAINTNLEGDADGFDSKPLVITMDESKINGHVSMHSFARPRYRVDLSVDKLKLDDYLPVSDEVFKQHAGSEKNTRAKHHDTAKKAVVPVDAISALNLDARLAINTLHYAGNDLSDLKVAIKADNGKLDIAPLKAGVFAGTLEAALNVDASKAKPALSGHFKLLDMSVDELAKWLDIDAVQHGKMTLDGKFNASGTNPQALFARATGSAHLEMANSVVRGLDLQDSVFAGIKDLPSGISQLDKLKHSADKVSASLSEDTQLKKLDSTVSLAKQRATLSSLKADLDKGHVSGNGWLDLASRDFDFNVGLIAPGLVSSDKYKNVSWPLVCKGNLGGDAADWCRPDQQGFKSLIEHEAQGAIKKKLAEKLGVTDKNEDDNHASAKDQAKDKIKDSKNKLKDKLHKLF